MEPTRDLTLPQHRTLVAALQAALGADTVQIETHISTLLLAGEFAYKLRKPVALPFLDFTTLAARAHDCEEELRLNRRTAPQLYLDVRPVRGTLAQPRIGEHDEATGAIDWLLRMRRFDNELLLDRLAARGALGEADVDALARRVADFHAALPASPAAYGDPVSVLAWARANFAALGEAVETDLHDWSEREFERIAPRLALRRAQGRVREGHGDLHLGNIVKLDGEPLPFDAIEFNPALRHGDTMGDAAFVFMDLWRHGLHALAWRFASAYAERGGDHEGIALLPFFVVYRALVRAQVAALRHDAAALARDLRTARELTQQLRRPRPLLLLTRAYIELRRGRRDACHALLREAIVAGRGNDAEVFFRWGVAILEPMLREALVAGIETAHVQHLVRRFGLVPTDFTQESWPWRVRVFTLGRFAVEVDMCKCIAERAKQKSTQRASTWLQLRSLLRTLRSSYQP